MDFSAMNYMLALPEIILLSMICGILVVDVFLPERYRALTYWLTQATLVIVLLVALSRFQDLTTSVTGYSNHYIIDRLAAISKIFIAVFSLFAFAYAYDFITKHKIALGEYYLLGLMSVLGMLVMVSAHSFLAIYLGIELLSLSLYAMVAMYKKSMLATEAAMKYFLLGGAASGLLLYGISLVYGMTGSVQLDVIGQHLQHEHSMVAIVGLIFILAGIIFKFGAAPFHMWVPDVYQGAATPTTLFIASAPKVAIFAVAIRVLVESMPQLHINWQHILIVISILSMAGGNILAIAQTNIKRMLAYSSIAHIGYTLLGIIAGPDSTQGYSAAMFYIFTYVIVAAGGFAIVGLLSNANYDFERLEDFRGLNARNPWIAFMFLLLLFSMAGVPPTVGFFAKLGLLEALVQAHYVWLAALALMFALIGAYYYIRVVMLMYFEEPKEGTTPIPAIISPSMYAVITLNGIAALLLGLLPSFFIDICRITVG